MITKQSPIVVKMKEEIEKMYDDGRNTLMGNDELMDMFNGFYPFVKEN